MYYILPRNFERVADDVAYRNWARDQIDPVAADLDISPETEEIPDGSEPTK